MGLASRSPDDTASERARIVPAFGRIGLIPEVGSSWLLTRRLGYQGAYGLFASGETLDGARARGLGLATSSSPTTTCSRPPAAGPSASRRSRPTYPR